MCCTSVVVNGEDLTSEHLFRPAEHFIGPSTGTRDQPVVIKLGLELVSERDARRAKRSSPSRAKTDPNFKHYHVGADGEMSYGTNYTSEGGHRSRSDDDFFDLDRV